MLGLLSATDPRWVEVALGDLGAVLVDHFHCELKAASSALALAARYPSDPRRVQALTELAREELTHVQQASEVLSSRGLVPGPPGEDTYARDLRRAAKTAQHEHLLDRLLLGSVIEARSCERLLLLSQAVPDEGLRRWYGALYASEARHHRVFAALAEDAVGAGRARERLGELCALEAEVLAGLPVLPRIH
jgi:tRNA-(ms[2]io[6]A)-hydroxylase